MSWLAAWFGYGLGAGAAKTVLGETKAPPGNPPRQQTEAQIRADEARYDDEAKRFAAEDADAKKGAKR
jgi:hypothetical protein